MERAETAAENRAAGSAEQAEPAGAERAEATGEKHLAEAAGAEQAEPVVGAEDEKLGAGNPRGRENGRRAVCFGAGTENIGVGNADMRNSTRNNANKYGYTYKMATETYTSLQKDGRSGKVFFLSRGQFTMPS